MPNPYPVEGAEHYRIKDPGSGDEFTYDAAKVELLGLGDYVIDKDPYGPDGRPAPTKPNLPLGEPLPGSKADRARRAAKKTTGAQGSGQDAGQSSADPKKEN